MKDFKAGDKVICLTQGEGVVTEVTKDETHNFNVICQFGNTRVCYSVNGKHPSYKGRMLYHADEPLSAVTKDPIKLPHISNAMKAINWLDKGKKIISDTFYNGEVYCLKDELSKVHCHDVATGLIDPIYTVTLFSILSHNWYEHKNQVKCDFIQAIRAYNKGYKVKLNNCTLCLNYQGAFILIDSEGLKTALGDEQLTSKNWEVIIK